MNPLNSGSTARTSIAPSGDRESKHISADRELAFLHDALINLAQLCTTIEGGNDALKKCEPTPISPPALAVFLDQLPKQISELRIILEGTTQRLRELLY